MRVLDNLHPQVHGAEQQPPAYLSSDVELVVGDVRDAAKVREALEGVDNVVHLAALVGVGQSMYQPQEYMSVNGAGTACLLETLTSKQLKRLIVASSMSVYGEGLYENSRGASVEDAARSADAMKQRQWDPIDEGGDALVPRPTPELKRLAIESVYALSKYDQERMCLMYGRAYNIPTVALRFFNVYGTRQALSNPYTGVMAIFASRLLNKRPPLVFEDGHQRRDFVSVKDIARACALALERKEAVGQAINVGSGEPRSILQVAESMADALGLPEIRAEVTGRFRIGDIRHCFADISQARKLLDYQPQVGFEEGTRELVEWLKHQKAEDRVESAHQELIERGLTVGGENTAEGKVATAQSGVSAHG